MMKYKYHIIFKNNPNGKSYSILYSVIKMHVWMFFDCLLVYHIGSCKSLKKHSTVLNRAFYCYLVHKQKRKVVMTHSHKLKKKTRAKITLSTIRAILVSGTDDIC